MSDLLVLCYHAVSERWPASLSVTPRRLEEQLALVVACGYRGVTFTEAVTEPAPGRRVAVTFDDGFRSVLDLAAPVLARLGLPATVFVPTSHVGGGPMAWPGIDRWVGTEHEGELAGLTWGELGDLAARGWEIGAHSCTHPRLTALGDAALARELEGSRRACEEALGRWCSSLAYPYGDVDDRVADAAAAAGYVAGGALPATLRGPTPLRFPRIGVFHRDDLRRFRLKVSPAVRRVRATRAWPALRSARARVRRR